MLIINIFSESKACEGGFFCTRARLSEQHEIHGFANSDDPAYFGGYINANYASVQRALGLDRAALTQYAVNSVKASFASADRKREILKEIRGVTARFHLG